MGPETNVESIKFQYNALAPTLVSGEVAIRNTDITLPVFTLFGSRPPLVSRPALPTNLPNVRQTILEDTRDLSYPQAQSRAQAMTDKSLEEVVTAEGELDAARYGALLKPRGLVGLRGAGFSYDGLYYVKQVTHKIRKGEYKQSFTLTREGTGAISPVVVT
jgi:hypothetical protein